MMRFPEDIEPVYLHPHATANAALTLYEGPVAIDGAAGTGALMMRMLPSPQLTLEAELAGVNVHAPRGRLKADVMGHTADFLVTRKRLRMGAASSTTLGGPISSFEKGDGTDLRDVGFQIVNFENFMTPGAYTAPVYGYPPHVATLRHGGWRVSLTAVAKDTEAFNSLKETGGYTFTHLGRVEREDGSPFAAVDARDILNALRLFLSFARGALCSVPIVWGTGHDGRVVWEQWLSSPVDPWKGRDTWFDELHGNLLAELFGAFAELKAHADLGEAFGLALHWYLRCNTRAGGMEGAIILGLTALDLLGALLVVDRVGTMTAANYDALSARFKLESLLDAMKVPLHVPGHTKLADLASFASANSWQNAAHALAEMRHGFVHSNLRRRKVALSAPNLALFGAWQLSLWYQELALLCLLQHRGEYRNRITAAWHGETEKVPWI
jgi:hypothetical protein